MSDDRYSTTPPDATIVEQHSEHYRGAYAIDDHWRRVRTWSSGSVDSIIVAGRDDVSAYHSTYPTGHDSRCGWCYLGAGHSADEHARQVAAQLQRDAEWQRTVDARNAIRASRGLPPLDARGFVVGAEHVARS